MLDKITFIKSICPTDKIIEYIGLYFDQMMLLYTILPKTNYSIVGTNIRENNFEIVISLADTSTASWFKSLIDLNVPFHVYHLYGRSLTVNTALNDNFVTVSITN